VNRSSQIAPWYLAVGEDAMQGLPIPPGNWWDSTSSWRDKWQQRRGVDASPLQKREVAAEAKRPAALRRARALAPELATKRHARQRV